jgi:hypothetical protein
MDPSWGISTPAPTGPIGFETSVYALTPVSVSPQRKISLNLDQ